MHLGFPTINLGLSISWAYFVLIYLALGLLDLGLKSIVCSLIVASLVNMVLTWKLVFLRSDRYKEHSPFKDIFFGCIGLPSLLGISIGRVYPYNGTDVLIYVVFVLLFGACHAVTQTAVLGIWWRE